MAGIKRTAADSWFSLYVRARDNFTCQRCFKKFRAYEEGGDNRSLMGLDNAHMFTRGHNMTRFEPDNCLSLCYGDHSYMDANYNEKRDLFIKKIGQKRFDELEVMSKISYKGVKKDQKMISDRFRVLFRQMLKDQRKVAFHNGV